MVGAKCSPIQRACKNRGRRAASNGVAAQRSQEENVRENGGSTSRKTAEGWLRERRKTPRLKRSLTHTRKTQDQACGRLSQSTINHQNKNDTQIQTINGSQTDWQAHQTGKTEKHGNKWTETKVIAAQEHVSVND
jgi:hypothetical protein